MNKEIPQPKQIELETIVFPIDNEPTYEHLLAHVGQALYEFRSALYDPGDATKPIVYGDEATTLIHSSRARQATVQTRSTENERVSYDIDLDAQFPIIVSVFDTTDTDEPSRAYGLLPTEANIPTLLSIHDYLRVLL